MTSDSATSQAPTSRRLAGQGALLFSGYAAAQGLSFFRNAVIGHALSKDNFGIAATITLILQVIETLSDLGADRLIVQAEQGDQPRFIATAHSMLAARGVLLTILLLAFGPAIAHFFGADQAATAFQLVACVPLIKGFMHLDFRRAQRRFDNRPQMLVEALPQAAALALIYPALTVTHDFNVVVLLSVAQAMTMVALSHVLSERPYRFATDTKILKQQFAFGWPILASALPLIAVYHGDRMIIGRLHGMESLANYSAAFMVTMVPGLIAAKVGHALMLPLFSDTLRRGRQLNPPFKVMTEATVLFAALYLAAFIIAGEALLPIVFGHRYTGLGPVTSWLAAMWALRMIQAVPGMALMAHGATKPFFVAGFVRALALPFVLYAALNGAPIATLAAIGCVFEALSLTYVAYRLERLEAGLGLILLTRAAFLIPVAIACQLTSCAGTGSLVCVALSTIATTILVAAIGATVMPTLRNRLRRILANTNAIIAGA